ncbi:TPA: hypothetical protein ACKP1B_000618 [Serratia fonticola]
MKTYPGYIGADGEEKIMPTIKRQLVHEYCQSCKGKHPRHTTINKESEALSEMVGLLTFGFLCVSGRNCSNLLNFFASLLFFAVGNP